MGMPVQKVSIARPLNGWPRYRGRMILRAVQFGIPRRALTLALMLCCAVGSFAATISSARENRGGQKLSEKNTRYRTHRVRRGETLSGIAHRYGTSVRAIRDANNLRGSNVKAGSRLKIPVSSARSYGNAKKSTSSRSSSRRRSASRSRSRYTTSAYESNPTAGDISAGEDPVVRAAAVKALGQRNGTVVAIDPSNGRILAMVNQQLALSSGAEPCSTIKVPVAMAALSEGIVDKDTPVRLGNRQLDMNKALAYSNNRYFEKLGQKLGFERVRHYAHLFGLGEKAGWNIEGEQLGEYPSKVLPAKQGGVGKMCSFGRSIDMTPLQLGAMLMAISNGGTLYYLQHPRSAEELENFQPKVKRYLDIAPLIPDVSEGMLGATQYGTARRLRSSFTSEDVLGKTGTCSEGGTRYGWFGSYADSQQGRIVVVVFLQGDRSVYGPKAAGIAGQFYNELDKHDYFAKHSAPLPTESALN